MYNQGLKNTEIRYLQSHGGHDCHSIQHGTTAPLPSAGDSYKTT